MGLKKSKNRIPNPEKGNIPARLARIIEIGEHSTKWGPKEQCYFWYSLPTRLIDMPESDFHGKQHMVRSAPLNMSNSEKSNIVKDHIAILDASFDLKGECVDLKPLLNKAIYLTIDINETDKGDFVNILNTMGVAEGMEVGELDTTQWYFNFDEPDVDVWTRHMSDYMKEKVQAALNYEGSAVQEMVLRIAAMTPTTE